MKFKTPPPQPPSPPGVFSQEVYAKAKARAQALLNNPKELQRDTQLALLEHRELMRHIVDHPPPGAGSTATMMKAMIEYAKVSVELLEALAPEAGGEGNPDAEPSTPREAAPQKPYLAGRAPSGVPIKRPGRPGGR